MKVLVTGHDGYIGSVLVPMLMQAGHEVHGLDSCLFEGCNFGRDPESIPYERVDVRDVRPEHLKGFDAVVHLAAISNDPLGNLAPDTTYEVNYRSSVRIAEFAKQAGVERFVFASSCSLYGAASPKDILSESAAFNPVTAYGESKVLVERDVSLMADDDFTPVFLRNATVYGVSPRLRLDLVVNDLVATAFVTGDILIKSDGTPWRPLVHVEDVASAMLASLEAPREAVHNEAFNIGRTTENYQIRDVADMVTGVVPESKVTYAEGGGPDKRCYRVSFEKAESSLPGFEASWTVPEGIRQLYEAFGRYGMEISHLEGSQYVRLRHISDLLKAGSIEPDLRWITTPARNP
jgi:nucleoside-diphosphate-sugar epimerase